LVGNIAEQLLDQLRITRLPALVVKGLEWPVEAKDGVPTLTGDALHPIVLPTFGRLRSDVDVVGTIRVLNQPLLVVVETGKLLSDNGRYLGGPKVTR
jgi:hypothetical protein